MNGARRFDFAGESLIARRSGALFWPARNLLLVADLHLGRPDRMARLGGALLPPWHDADTLARLGAEIAALNPAGVALLGDSFDDNLAGESLARETRATLSTLAQGRDWLWLAGNHDPAPLPEGLPGAKAAELAGPIALRHETGTGPDISGHLHPVVRLAGRRWRAFVISGPHLVLPAFGQYTGGLEVSSPDFRALLPRGLAICCSETMFVLPFPAPPPARPGRGGRNRPPGPRVQPGSR